MVSLGSLVLALPMAIQDASDRRPCDSGEGHHSLSRLLLESPTLTEHLLWATRCPCGIFLFARLSVLHYSLSVPHRPEHQSSAESGSIPLNPVTAMYPPLHPDTLESPQACPRPCPQHPPTSTPKCSLNPPTSHLSTSTVLSKMPSVLAQTSQSPPQPSPRYTQPAQASQCRLRHSFEYECNHVVPQLKSHFFLARNQTA